MIEQNKDSKIILKVFHRLAKLGSRLKENGNIQFQKNGRKSSNSHGQGVANIASEGQFTTKEF